jgi:hypothetical protein
MQFKSRLAWMVLLLVALSIATPHAAASQSSGGDGRAYLARIAATRVQTPSFAEDFASGGKQWRLGSAAESLTGFANGALLFQLGPAITANAALAPLEAERFLADVTAVHHSGTEDATASLLFHVVDSDNLCAFSVSASGYYAISRISDGSAVHLTPPTQSPAIQQGEGAVNRLTVLARNEALVFLVNDIPVQVHTNPVAATGAIGLGAAVYSGEGAQIAFDDLRVWTAGSPSAPIARAAPTTASAPTPEPSPTHAQEPTATPAARPTSTPSPVPTPTPLPEPVSLESLPIAWETLEADFEISNVRLVEESAGSGINTSFLVFDVTARQDLGIFIYMAAFNDDEGELLDSAELEFQIAPDAVALTDFMGGWTAGAYGTVRMQLPLRMTGVVSIDFERFF